MVSRPPNVNFHDIHDEMLKKAHSSHGNSQN